jgi:hypothetical protein
MLGGSLDQKLALTNLHYSKRQVLSFATAKIFSTVVHFSVYIFICEVFICVGYNKRCLKIKKKNLKFGFNLERFFLERSLSIFSV